MQRAMHKLGAAASGLSSTRSVQAGNESSAALRSLAAKPVTGTDLVDMSFTDSHAKLAARTLRAYVGAYVSGRSGAAAARPPPPPAGTRQQARRQFRELSQLAAQADTERSKGGVSVLTQT